MGNKIKIEPRKTSDRGGYICMPLEANVPEGKSGWKLTTCPKCGSSCWKMPETDLIAKLQGATALCTICALKAGAVEI